METLVNPSINEKLLFLLCTTIPVFVGTSMDVLLFAYINDAEKVVFPINRKVLPTVKGPVVGNDGVFNMYCPVVNLSQNSDTSMLFSNIVATGALVPLCVSNAVYLI